MADTTTNRGYHYPLQKDNPLEARRYLDEIDADVETLADAVSGPKVLSADATAVSSNTLTAQSGLLQNVTINVVCSFKINLWLAATLAEGWQLDLNGGSAGATWIKGMVKGYDSLLPDGTLNPAPSLALTRGILALATNIQPQDAFSGFIEITGSLKPSSTGTFGPRIAQVAHASGNVQTLKGSNSLVQPSA